MDNYSQNRDTEITPKVKILLVDDHKLVSEGIATMLEEEFKIVGIASSGEEAINKIGELLPDVILMDIVMNGMNGIEASRWIKDQYPDVKVILLSMEVRKDYLAAGIQTGVSGYLHKDIGREKLIEAIRTVSRGEKYFDEAITNLVLDDFLSKAEQSSAIKISLKENLTKREIEVLKLAATGISNKEVADQLFISMKTVETHKTRILEKLGLKNRTELVKYAIKNNLVPLE